MSVKESWESRIDTLTDTIKDDDIRTILKVASSNKAYPKDCITNGALELLVRKIIKLEARPSNEPERVD